MDTIASLVKNHRLYADYARIKDTLARHQFVCWIAGGAVRDFLLGREVNEFDLVTDATTEVLKQLFPQAVLVGESFGVIKVSFNDGRDFFDLATFREESDYVDGRRPSLVRSSTPTLDSVRRDFTVNAIFWDDVSGVLRDYQSGVFDLQSRVLKCVGLARTRFSEDYLRIIRLMRFSLQLNFKTEPETLKAAEEMLPQIARVSGERIWSEFKKIESSKVWDRAVQSGLFRSVFKEIFGEASWTGIVWSELKLTRFLAAVEPSRDFSSILKERLKISNLELEDYKSSRFVLNNFNKMTLEERAFEVEKSEKLKSVVEDMARVGMLAENSSREIAELLAEFPSPLVVPQDLLNLIPAAQISTEMRFIRLNQLGKKFRTKGEVLSYLRQKYA
ncbi:MAG: CCA tRNA nucleotidyltransferase [Pseudobdellovibrio sp.]